jgi:hypothetical protein
MLPPSKNLPQAADSTAHNEGRKIHLSGLCGLLTIRSMGLPPVRLEPDRVREETIHTIPNLAVRRYLLELVYGTDEM